MVYLPFAVLIVAGTQRPRSKAPSGVQLPPEWATLVKFGKRERFLLLLFARPSFRERQLDARGIGSAPVFRIFVRPDHESPRGSAERRISAGAVCLPGLGDRGNKSKTVRILGRARPAMTLLQEILHAPAEIGVTRHCRRRQAQKHGGG
jgi:hypothetical protein